MPCAEGYRCVKETYKTVEEICPRNTYSKEGASECSDCPPNETSVAGSSTCNKCPDGMGFTGIQCASCEYGSISVDGVCTLCPPGQTSDPKKTSCIPCRAGYKCIENSENTGKIEIICEANTYSPAGSTTCEMCRTGTISDEGSSICKNCPVGFGYNTGYICRPCIGGRYSADSGLCTSCESGEYNNEDKSGCRPCRGGYKCEKGEWATTEEICPENTYSTSGSSDCTPCPAGETSARGAIACSTCPPGTGKSSMSSGICEPCTTGYYSGGGLCKICEPGTFSYPDRSSCRFCKSGHRCFMEDGILVEKVCGENTFAPPGSKDCFDCANGQESDVGSRKCTYCPEGTGFQQGEISRCPKCKPGQYAQGENTNGLCVLCPAGMMHNSDFKTGIKK